MLLYRSVGWVRTGLVALSVAALLGLAIAELGWPWLLLVVLVPIVLLGLHWFVFERSRLGAGYREWKREREMKPINDAIQPHKARADAAEERADIAEKRADAIEETANEAQETIKRIQSNPNLHQGLS